RDRTVTGVQTCALPILEMGLLATHLGKLPAESERPSPADGVVCGTGLAGGRPCCVASYDFTVHGGSIGPIGERKVARLRDLALQIGRASCRERAWMWVR